MPASSHVAGGDGFLSGSSSSIIAGAVSGYHLLKVVGYSRTKEVPNGKQIHLLKVVGYSRTKEVPNGKQIDSCQFRVGGRTWRVRYYPNGSLSDNVDSISLYLKLDDTVAKAEAVKAQAEFSLLDQHGKPVPPYTRRTITNNYAVNESWGYPKFIEREELEKSEHLKEDSFTVKVDVTIMSEIHAEKTPSIVVPPSDMHLHFGHLLSSKAGVDVEFHVGGETFSAPRSVLAERSPVFRAELFDSMKESTTNNTIRIDDMEAQVFDALLTFIYTDALPDMKQQEEHDMAQHLLVAADMYDLERLKLICEDRLSKRINMSSVTNILALAERHHCHGLKAACLVFLDSTTKLDAAMESKGFGVLTKSWRGAIKDLLMALRGKRKSKTRK